MRTAQPGTAPSPWSAAWLVRAMRAGWPAVVAGAVLGAVLGLLVAASATGYSATATLAVTVGANTTETATAVRSATAVVESDTVLAAAAEDLGTQTSAIENDVRIVVQSGTSLIDIVAYSDSAEGAVALANSVAAAAVAENRAQQDLAAADYLQNGQELIANGQLSAAGAEAARQASIGQLVGDEQSQALQRALSVSPVAEAARADAAGLARSTALALGAAAGGLLATLLVLSGALRSARRARRSSDLLDLRTPGAPRVSPTAGSLAGAFVESGSQLGVIIQFGPEAMVDPASSSVLEALRLQRESAAMLEVVADPTDGVQQIGPGRWRVGGDAAKAALSRTGRHQLPDELASHRVVIAIGADSPWLTLLQGQQDFFCAAVVGSGTRLQAVEQTLLSLADAEPVVLLAPK